MDSPFLPARKRRTSLSLVKAVRSPRKTPSLSKLFGRSSVTTNNENEPMAATSTTVHKHAYCPSSPLRPLNPNHASDQLEASSQIVCAATAPAADRRSKRFEFSNWKSDLPQIAASSPTPIARHSQLPRLQTTNKLSSNLCSSKKPSDYISDEEEDSPFIVGPMRRATSLKDRQKQQIPVACSPSKSSPAGFLSSSRPPHGLSSAPPLLRHKLSRDLTMTDLSSMAREPIASTSRIRPASSLLTASRVSLSASHPQPSPPRNWSSFMTTASGIDWLDPPTKPVKDATEASAGAPFLDSLDEDEINDQFAPRIPQFSTEDVEMVPPSHTPGHHRSTSAYPPHLPFNNATSSQAACRRAASSDALFSNSANQHLFNNLPRKRNANGAIIAGSNRASLLASNPPIVASHSSSPRTQLIDSEDSDDDMDVSSACPNEFPDDETMSPPQPAALTDSSSVSSHSLASSRNSSASLKTSLSSSASAGFGPIKARRLSDATSSISAHQENIFTPVHYSHVKPLQAAFASSGLINKRTKARDSGVSVETPPAVAQMAQVELCATVPLNIEQQAAANPGTAITKAPQAMPDTPCKPALFQALASQAEMSSPQAGDVDEAALKLDSPISTGTVKSPTVKNVLGSPINWQSKTAPLFRYKPGRPSIALFRRRSSGQLCQETRPVPPNSGGSSSSGATIIDEPMTPTRSKDGMHLDIPQQLAATPTIASPISRTAIPSADSSAPCTTPISSCFPFDITNPPLLSRPTFPPVVSRPQFKHRHSGSVIVAVRRRERSQSDRFGTQFTVIRPLGKGVSSEAFAVRSIDGGQISAVKRTRIPFSGPKDRIRRLEEVDILRDLTVNSATSCAFVVQFFDAWEQNGHLYIQTELCEHGNLAEWLNEHGAKHDRLDEARVWKIATELALGLSYIHGRQIIHLDLKPANIFITQEGSLKIGDFGLATRWPRATSFEVMQGAGIDAPAVDQTVGCREWTKTHPKNKRPRSPSIGLVQATDLEREGDREYIAPEVMNGVYGKPADIFSFGLLLLEAAANVVLPDNGNSWRKLRSDDFTDVHATMSDPLIHLIKNLVKSDPTQRVAVDDILRHPVIACLARRYLSFSPNLSGAVIEESPHFADQLFLDATASPCTSMDL